MWWNSVNPIKYWLSCMDQMNFWCLLFRITLWTYLGFKILRWPLWAKFGGFIHLPEPNSIFDVNSFHNLWPILDWNMQMPQADCNFYKLFVPPYVTAWMKQVAHKTWNAFKPTGLWGVFRIEISEYWSGHLSSWGEFILGRKTALIWSLSISDPISIM